MLTVNDMIAMLEFNAAVGGRREGCDQSYFHQPRDFRYAKCTEKRYDGDVTVYTILEPIVRLRKKVVPETGVILLVPVE